jgi:dTDP-4-amino-4,6-dideoxyglucose
MELVAPLLPELEEMRADIEAMLTSRWLTNRGVFVRRLEERVAKATGFAHAVSVANGTLGLMTAIRTLGWSGEVILPSFTFPATAHAVCWAGCEPVLADVVEDTFTLDPESVARLVGERTAGVLPVDIFGVPAPLEELSSVAGGAPLLCDAAHAFGVPVRERGVARAHVYSLHATKAVVAGEGGIIATDDLDLAERARRIANFGFEPGADCSGIGLNAKMPELSAILAFHQLDLLDEVLTGHRCWDAAYREALVDVPGLGFQRLPDEASCSRQFVPILVDPARFGRSADEVHAALLEDGIATRRYFAPAIHQLSCYAGRLRCDDLSRTEALTRRVLCLPVHPGRPASVASGIAERIRGMARG